jgi:branched-chain amino acid transport system ATP-binding protein
MWPLIDQIAADGIGVMIVEQQVDAVLALAQRAYVMVEGTIRLSGDAADLRARRSELIDHFVGRVAS